MAKIVGIGELQEGILERDPLDESLQLRVCDGAGTQRVFKVEELLSEYVGHSVRLTVAYTRALEAAEGLREGVRGVTYGDLAIPRDQ